MSTDTPATSTGLSNLLHEERRFPPDPQFAEPRNVVGPRSQRSRKARRTRSVLGAPAIAFFLSPDRLERALDKAGVEHDVLEYAEAGHSFMNRNATGPLRVLTKVARLDYHHASAEDAWGRILRFFATHLH